MSKRVGELYSSVVVGDKESVRVNDTGTAWEVFPPMDRRTYDSNNDGIVDKARIVSITARNNTGSTITKGKVVYVTGATGNHPTIALADKDSESTSSKTLGMVISDIANNADGAVAINGTVDDLNTNAYTAGTALYLGDDGGWTSTRPTPPAHAVFIGWVTIQSSTGGRIVLHIQNGYELNELHDVLISSVSNDQVLTYESSSGLWKNKTPSGGGGSTRAMGILAFNAGTETAADGDTLTVLSHTIPANTLSTNGDTLRLKIQGKFVRTDYDIDMVPRDVIIQFAGNAYSFPDAIDPDRFNWDILIVRTSGTTARMTWRYGYTGFYEFWDITSGIAWSGTEDISVQIFSDTGGAQYLDSDLVELEFIPKI